jgi:hypothetical protein
MRQAWLMLALVTSGALVIGNACSSDGSTAANGAAGEGGDATTSGGESPTERGGSNAQSGNAGERTSGGDGGATPVGASGAAGAPGAAGGASAGEGGSSPGEGGTGPSGEGGGGGADPCDFGEASSAGTNEELNLFGQVVYFADGESLPAGRYRIEYVDGCMKYGGGQDWTIHAYANGSFGWWFVGETTAQQIVLPPGTVGYAASGGAYATFDECVAANLLLAPVEFDFVGGKLGVWLQDSPYSDNVAGVDNRNPKWSLVRLNCE